MKNLLLTLLLFAAALASPAQQTTPVTTLATLNDLLARVPRSGETVAVRSGYNGQDWGGDRFFTHAPTNIATLATNVAHVFNVITNTYNVGGQWRSADMTNSVQDSRWWRMGSATADNYWPLSNAVYWMTTNFVASTLTIPAEGGINSFTTATTLTIPGNVSLKSNDAWLDFSPNGRTNATADIQYVGSISTGIPLQSAVLAGTNVITLTSSPSWNAFDIIALQNTNNYSFGGRPTYKAGEYAVVASVTASNVTLLQPLVRGYPATYTHAYKITHTTASVTGLRMKFAPGSGGLRFDYPGPLVTAADLYLTNSYYKHLTINNGYMPTVRRVVAQDNHTSVGANYGIVVGSSYGVTIDNCYVATTRHGITFGDSETALDIPSERSRVTDTFAQAVGGVEPALDFHGIAFNNVVTDSVLYGVNAAGGNVLVNNDLFNGQNYRAVTGTEAVQFNTQLLDNRFWLTTANPDAKEWAAYLAFGPVNPGAAADVNTNIWAGTFGNTTNQYLRLQRNTLNFLTPVSRSGDYGFYVSDSTLLAANPNAVKATFGGVIATDNIAYYPDTQGFSNLNTSSLVINLITNITLRETIIKDNHLTYGGIYVLTTGGDIDIADNTIHRSLDGVAAIKVIRANGAANATQHAPAYTRIWRNLITDARTGGILAYNLYGTVDARNNIVREFGLSGSSTYGMFIGGAGADLTNTFYVTHKDNSYSATSGTTAALYVETPSAPFIDVDTQLGGTTTYGTLPSVLSTKIQPYSLVGNGFTNAVAYIGRYTTANLPTTALPGAFAHDVTVDQPAFWNGTSWRYWLDIAGTNFPNIYVTNTANVKDIAAETVSVGPSRTVFATLSDPLYLFHSTNGPLRMSVQNNNTNSAAQAGVSLTAGGGAGSLLMRSPNDSTAALTNRLVLDGPRIGLDIDSGADVKFMVAGVPFATLSQTLLDVPSITSTFATNVGTHVLIVNGTGSQNVKSMAFADLKNAMGTSSSTNLDNLTVTNTVRFGGDFYVTGGVGGTNKFQVTSAEVTSYTPVWLYHDFVVASGHDVYSLSTNFFNLGIKQFYPGYSDYAWLTSVGFKNATPLRAANILDSTTIDWTTTSTTNVTPSIKSQSISTNLIDSTFYSLLMLTNSSSGGSVSTTTNYLDRTLFYSRGQVVVGTTNALQSLVTSIPAHLSKTISAGSITTNFALHVTAGGTLTSTNDNWSNNKFTVKVGGLSIVHTITDDTSGVSLTDAPWDIDCHVTVTATGTNATVYATSILRFRYDDGGVVTYPWVFTFPGVVSGTLDTTGSVDVDVLYSMDTSGQEINVKCNSVVATVQGAEVLTSGGSAIAVSPTFDKVGNYIVVSNSTDWATIQSGTITTTNLPSVGSSLLSRSFGTLFNASGATRTYSLRFIIGGVTNYYDDGPNIATNTLTTSRVLKHETTLVRGTNDLIQVLMEHSVSATTAPTYSGIAGSFASAATVSPRLMLPTEFDWDGSSNLLWQVDVAMSAASTNYSMSIRSGGTR